jgi:hypothetical protein
MANGLLGARLGKYCNCHSTSFAAPIMSDGEPIDAITYAGDRYAAHREA